MRSGWWGVELSVLGILGSCVPQLPLPLSEEEKRKLEEIAKEVAERIRRLELPPTLELCKSMDEFLRGVEEGIRRFAKLAVEIAGVPEEQRKVAEDGLVALIGAWLVHELKKKLEASCKEILRKEQK
jgi:hypothetical protein